MINRFQKRGYDRSLIEQQINKAKLQEREQLLKEKKKVQNPPILDFCRKKNLRVIISTKLIENGKVKRKFTNKEQGKCTPCLANNKTLCCKQIVHTTTFRSNQTNRKFAGMHQM